MDYSRLSVLKIATILSVRSSGEPVLKKKTVSSFNSLFTGMSETIDRIPYATDSYTAPAPAPPSNRVGCITATQFLRICSWSFL